MSTPASWPSRSTSPNPDDVDAARDRIDAETEGHGADVVVNAAGIAVLGPVEVITERAARDVFDTNLFGLLRVARPFLPAMRAPGTEGVVNMSSILGRFVLPGTGMYAATKYAVEAVSDVLRVELSPFGISVVVVEPGVVATDLYDEASEAGLHDPNVTPSYAPSGPTAMASPCAWSTTRRRPSESQPSSPKRPLRRHLRRATSPAPPTA
jgi:NAD(P)-dependent dehydrogenase (short-subunit alcohol dehydrogenase family)